MKTRYVLLKLKPHVDDLFLVVEEPGDFEHPHEQGQEGGCDDCREYYEDKFCSTDMAQMARQFVMHGDDDPHHLFEFVALKEADGVPKPLELFQDVLGEPIDKMDPEKFHES
jgi:hypothetical protein